MRHHFAQPAREEVPPVTRPYSFGVESFDQLSNDCFNASPLLHQKERPSLLLSFRRTIRCKQAQTLSSQLLRERRTPIVAISQGPAFGVLQQSLGHRQLMHISRGQVKPDNHTRPTDSQMCAQAEEGLMSKFVIAISGQFTQS